MKLLCSEVRAIARVKLSLPTLPKAKLHYPQDNFTYEVNFTYPHGKLSCQKQRKGTFDIGISKAHLLTFREVEKKPPLCKGRWLAQRDGGIVKSWIIAQNNPSAAFGVSSLYTMEPLVCASRLFANRRKLGLQSLIKAYEALHLWLQMQM